MTLCWHLTYIHLTTIKHQLPGFPGGSDGKESAYSSGDPGSIPGSRQFAWRREWLPTPGFLPGEFHGQRSLEGYSPWGHRESDMTEQLTQILITPRIVTQQSTMINMRPA